ncbi:hypothetical protein SeLEV6574_g04064 [Synchytrium endobioticum]|uniref:CS domain-containing protein n=1 Tax=Synchytrium endobioticum TaxID=286115 RepID=A0A507D123_9FUNG|nr:hypothetical protein SeLEV6574_g04064 [Synchytrium endobioticum]
MTEATTSRSREIPEIQLKIAPNPKTIQLFPGGEQYIESLEEGPALTLTVCLPRSAKAKDIKVDYGDDWISVYCEGDQKVEGKLFSTINKHDVVWQLETSKDGRRVLTVNMEKVTSARWPVLVNGPHNEKIDPHSLYRLAERDLHEARGTSNQIEALQYNIDALAKFKNSAEHNNIPSILKLAAWYQFGAEASNNIPVKRDVELAFDLNLKAAELGNCEACYILGGAYAHVGGNSFDKAIDFSQALKWFTNCLHHDDHLVEHSRVLYVSAAWQAGLILLQGGHGLGDPAPERALTYWKLSGGQGHPASMFNIGLLMMNSWGTADRNIEGGVRLMLSAIQLDPDHRLKLPPQLDGLAPLELENLIQMAKHDKEAKIEALVEKIKSERPSCKAEKRKRRKPKTKEGSLAIVGAIIGSATALGIAYLAYRYRQHLDPSTKP